MWQQIWKPDWKFGDMTAFGYIDHKLVNVTENSKICKLSNVTIHFEKWQKIQKHKSKFGNTTTNVGQIKPTSGTREKIWQQIDEKTTNTCQILNHTNKLGKMTENWEPWQDISNEHLIFFYNVLSFFSASKFFFSTVNMYLCCSEFDSFLLIPSKDNQPGRVRARSSSVTRNVLSHRLIGK